MPSPRCACRVASCFTTKLATRCRPGPANQTDGEQKVAGERMLLRQVPGGLQILAPGREEIIPQPPDWQDGYPRAVREALEAYGRGDPPPIPPSECAHAVRLIFDSYRAAGVR